jgi:hypothetical protein
LEVLLFTSERASSIREADLRDIFKMASKNVCTSAALVSPDPLSPAPHNFSATKTPEKTEEDPDDSEPAAK